MADDSTDPNEAPRKQKPDLPVISTEQWRLAYERATHSEAYLVARAQGVTRREAYRIMGRQPPDWADDLDDEVDGFDDSFRDR